MKIRVSLVAAAFCLGLAVVSSAWAADPGADDALSPALREAIKGLSAEDYAAREKALKQVQQLLGKQLAALVSAEDPETQTRLAALLEFNDGLIRWSLDALKLPDEQRKVQLKWGLRPEVLPSLGLLFSAQSDKRIEGVKALGKLDDPETSAMIARLIDDPDRAVYIAAMDVAYDRKPTKEIVDALWNRAVESGFAIYRAQTAVAGANIVFRGRNMGVMYSDNNAYRHMQDNQIATEVLLNYKSPLVAEKLTALFERIAHDLEAPQPDVMRNRGYTAQTEPMKNAYRLAEANGSKEIVPALYRIATIRNTMDRQAGQYNAEKYFWSSRTTALATIVRITEQTTEDYKLKKMVPVGGIWCTPTEADENAAVAKLKAWWQKNAANYGVQPEAVDAAASQPATQPVDAAEDPVIRKLPRVRPGRIGVPLEGAAIEAAPK